MVSRSNYPNFSWLARPSLQSGIAPRLDSASGAVGTGPGPRTGKWKPEAQVRAVICLCTR